MYVDCGVLYIHNTYCNFLSEIALMISLLVMQNFPMKKKLNSFMSMSIGNLTI